MRWTRSAIAAVALAASAGRRSRRIGSSTSTAARPSTSSSARRRRRQRRLCACARPPLGQIHSRQSDDRRRRTCRARAATRRRATSIAVAPKDGTAIGAMQPGALLAPLLADTPSSTIRRNSSISAAPTAASTSASCARDAPIKIVQGHVHAGGHHRHAARGRDLARHADPRDQRARRQVPHRHRLCRHQRDRARDRAQARSTACAAWATPACSR